MIPLLARAQRGLRIFAPRQGVLLEAEALSGELMRLRVGGEALRAMWPLQAGQQISLLVDSFWPRGGRNYTVARCEADEPWVELIIHTRHDGAGARFARDAEVGQEVQLWGPGGGFYAPSDATDLIYVSDETGIGSAIALLDRHSTARACVVVNDIETARSVSRLQPRLHCVHRRPEDQQEATHRDRALERWLDEQAIRSDTHLLITGRIRSCHALRHTLLEHGVQSAKIHVRGYWDDRRTPK